MSIETKIKIRVYIPPFINHKRLDADSYVYLKDGARMSDLYHYLKIPLPLRLSFLYFLNYEPSKWNALLKDGDMVTFLFPVTGG
jgi:molybdopterin converting factor small subunit